jgi:hypothetical protein
MKVFLVFLLISLTVYAVDVKRSFIHPGIWFKQEDLDRMRLMLQANLEPWKTTATRLVGAASKTRGSGASVIQTNAYSLQDGGSNILHLAMAWVITGDISYGNAARDKINEWSVYQSGGDCLRQGIGTSSLVNAAEIIRFASVNGTKVNWPSDQIVSFQNMLVTYMTRVLETLRTGGDGGWGTPAINGLASIGVFCNQSNLR